MSTKSRNSISEQLNFANVALNNSINDPEILNLVSNFGYTKEKLEEGLNLYKAAVDIVNTRTRLAGAQYQATEELKVKEKLAREAYQNLAKVARAVFKQDQARLAQLGIVGEMPKKIAEFIARGYTVFDNALSIDEIKTALSHFGYDEAKLTEERQKIVDFDLANQRQEAAKGEVQQASKNQEKALKEMNEWVAQYIKIARVALKDKKQLMEKIGVRVYSSKTPAQRQAPKKASATRKAKKGQG